jgi:hypothetical protein
MPVQMAWFSSSVLSVVRYILYLLFSVVFMMFCFIR